MLPTDHNLHFSPKNGLVNVCIFVCSVLFIKGPIIHFAFVLFMVVFLCAF